MKKDKPSKKKSKPENSQLEVRKKLARELTYAIDMLRQWLQISLAIVGEGKREFLTRLAELTPDVLINIIENLSRFFDRLNASANPHYPSDTVCNPVNNFYKF